MQQNCFSAETLSRTDPLSVAAEVPLLIGVSRLTTSRIGSTGAAALYGYNAVKSLSFMMSEAVLFSD